jgi:2-iminobutanoate/2-iminopropanoate deaminase
MNVSNYCFLLFFFGILACTSPSEEKTKTQNSSDTINEATNAVVFHPSHEPKKSTAPFSDVVQVGDLFYLSGQIGMDHSTRELVQGGIKAETTQALENIKAVLGHHGLSMRQVVKATVILDEIDDFAAFNKIYKSYFPQKPARATFAAESLARGAKIEIEVVATRAAK